jgi:hypothetical protein
VAVRGICWRCWTRRVRAEEALNKSRFSCLYGLSYEQRASDTAALLCSGHQHRCGHSDHLLEQSLIPWGVFVLEAGSAAVGFSCIWRERQFFIYSTSSAAFLGVRYAIERIKSLWNTEL